MTVVLGKPENRVVYEPPAVKVKGAGAESNVAKKKKLEEEEALEDLCEVGTIVMRDICSDTWST